MPQLPFQNLLKSLTWSVPTKSKEVFLTFDDGPIPVVTPWVIETLNKFDAKATFFCVGDNVKKHPEIYQQLLENGHRVGNHTMNHLNGWMNFNSSYFTNVDECASYVKSDLFRPPYGKIRPTQIYRLRKDYRIIMWNILTRDYDESLDGEYCFTKVKKNVKPGSIIVFHDSLKAEKRLRYALPLCLEYLKAEGYKLSAIR